MKQHLTTAAIAIVAVYIAAMVPVIGPMIRGEMQKPV